MNEETLLWSREQLKQRCSGLVLEGVEFAKVDFKTTISFDSDQAKGDLLKDVAAIANTFDPKNQNYGLIIFGACAGKFSYLPADKIINEDKFQASIDDLLKHYIDPFISLHLYMFKEDSGSHWGVIVIPPSRNAPHIFIKDIHKRNRGDIYVRRNTVTEKALSGDFSRFFRQHFEEHTHELRFQLHEMTRRVAKLEEQERTFKLQSDELDSPTTDATSSAKVPPLTAMETEPDLLELIEQKLKARRDPISEKIKSEAKRIISFQNSDSVPWIVNIDKVEVAKILGMMEEVCSPLWKAYVKLLMEDVEGEHEDDLVQGISYLAEKYEAPVGASYNEDGVSIRYYPLIVLLYISFIAGVFKKRDKFLKKLLEIPLKQRTSYEVSVNIIYALFYVRRADDVFKTFHPQYPRQTWCDSLATYLKNYLISYFPSEEYVEDYETAFFKGEFALCIASLGVNQPGSTWLKISVPSSGAYFYYHSAHTIISKFLKEEHKFLEKIYTKPLEEVLKGFDDAANKVISFSCSPSGFINNALVTAYPEKGIML